MRLRAANLDDAKILFTWRNDEETRKHSLNDKKISWENHLPWLEESLLSSTCKLYIAENEEPVGTVRADKTEEGVELSWTIAPEARGHGYGKLMVMQFVQEVLAEEKIFATIEEKHIASIKIAEALGLHPAELINHGMRSFRIWR